MFSTLARATISRRFWGTTATAVLLLMVLACSSINDIVESPTSAAEDGSEMVSGPAVDIEKLTNGIDADTSPGPSIPVGDEVTWTFIVTNYGSVTLVEALVEDDQLGEVCRLENIPSGEVRRCSVSQRAIDGQYRNVGTVTATDGTTRVSDSDPSHYLGGGGAFVGVEVRMSINGEDANFPTGPHIAVGDDVFFEYRVSNIGDEILTDWLVEDSAIGGPACRSTGPLDPTESFTCRRGPVPAQPGQYATVATVTASNGSIRVTDEDPAHYYGIEEVTVPACGLGYWKNHLSAWRPTPYGPHDSVGSVFPSADLYGLDWNTLLEALEFGGGPDANGGAMILLRHAVAALLNASHPEIYYRRTEADVIAQVNRALNSGNRDAMLTLKDMLESDNEAGCGLD